MKKDIHGYIGVFDSGVGGISVLRELTEILPEENFYYYGDSLYAPYGEKSVKEVTDRTMEIMNMMVNKGVKAIVVACNTATSIVIPIIRSVYNIPVIGIEPALKPAIVKDHHQRVLVLATSNTLKLDKYKQLAEVYGENITLYEVAAVGLAKAIEEGDIHSQKIKNLLKQYLNPYKNKIDAVVLGCTHHPFVKDEIQAILGDIDFYDGALGASKQLKRQLTERALLNNKGGDIIFATSSNNPSELNIYKKLYGM